MQMVIHRFSLIVPRSLVRTLVRTFDFAKLIIRRPEHSYAQSIALYCVLRPSRPRVSTPITQTHLESSKSRPLNSMKLLCCFRGVFKSRWFQHAVSCGPLSDTAVADNSFLINNHNRHSLSIECKSI